MAAELDTHTADGQTESKLTQRGRRTVRPTYRSSGAGGFPDREIDPAGGPARGQNPNIVPKEKKSDGIFSRFSLSPSVCVVIGRDGRWALSTTSYRHAILVPR
jgi:hypothetical protein